MSSEDSGFERIYDDLQSLWSRGSTTTDVGDAFEDVVLFFLRNDPVWAATLGLDQKPENAQLWRNAPRSWRWSNTDIGTDILVKDAQNNLWAIQAKGYKRERIVPKPEVQAFLSDSSRREVHARLLVTSASGLSQTAWNNIDGAEKPCHVVSYEHLVSSRTVWPSSLKALKRRLAKPAPQQKPRNPRKHQKKAIKKVVEGFMNKSNTRGQLLMACGTGKTLVGQRVAEQLGAKTVLILFPSLMLVSKAINDWVADAADDKHFEWLAVCSDSSVGRQNDEALQHVRDMGIPHVSTDPNDVGKFLKKRRPRGVPTKVVFCTYQSTQVVIDATRGEHPFDLVIFDEAHKTAAPWQSTTSTNPFTIALDDQNLQAKRRLFMTATQRVYGPHVKARAQSRESGDENFLASMDNENIYGPTLHEYSFRDAMDDEVLANYQVLGVVVTEPEITPLIKQRSNIALRDQDRKVATISDASTAAIHVAVAKAMKHRDWNITSLITFHNTIKSAENYAHAHNHYRGLLGLKPIHTDTVKGNEKASKRIEALKVLGPDQDPALVSNARCLTEGIDVPSLSGVAFIEPRRSPIDIAQAIGRAIRKPPGSDKTVGYIVVPIYIPLSCYSPLLGATGSDQDVEELLEGPLNAAFTPLIEVIQGLRNFDGVITEVLNKYRTARGARSSARGQSRLIGERHTGKKTKQGALQVTLDFRGIAATPAPSESPIDLPESALDIRKFTEALSVRCIDDILERCANNWYENLGKLRTHYEEYGDHPTRLTNKSLTTWVERQRSIKDQLSPDKRKLLDDLPHWQWEPDEENWTAAYQWVLSYTTEHSESPSKYSDDEIEAFHGRWIHTQRANFRREKLSQERILRLKRIPGWQWEPDEESFTSHHQWVLSYVKKHNRQPRQSGINEEEEFYGRWVSTQRTAFKNGKLSRERILLLEKIPGWEWDGVSARWRKKFELYKQWVEKNGAHPQAAGTGYETDPEQEKLAGWAQRQRESRRGMSSPGKSGRGRKRRALRDEEIALLDGLTPPFVWDFQDERDEAAFAWIDELEDFVRETGHFPTRSTNKDLNHKMFRQMKRMKAGSMEPERQARLERIPGFAKRYGEYLVASEQHKGRLQGAASWDDSYERVAAFAQRKKRLPKEATSDPDEQKLGRWLGKRLKEYHDKAPRLDQDDRRARLERLPGWKKRYREYVRRRSS